MEQVRLFVRGLAEIKIIKHIIDCSAQPFIPKNWSIKEKDQLSNRITAKDFEFNPQNLLLYLSKKQQQGIIEGNKLKKELKNQKVLPANVLDYLLRHPEIIPEEWKGKIIFFWGTIYCNFNCNLFVRYLGWDGDRWDWGHDYLGYVWCDDCPAVCASV